MKIAQGHLKKVIAMEEGGEYCIDIMFQLQAVESALKKAGDLILENHLKTCVTKAIKQGKDKEVISEIMKVWTKSS